MLESYVKIQIRWDNWLIPGVDNAAGVWLYTKAVFWVSAMAGVPAIADILHQNIFVLPN